MTAVLGIQHHRFVWQFILTSTQSGKMLYQLLRHRLNAADHAAFVVRLLTGGFHQQVRLNVTNATKAVNCRRISFLPQGDNVEALFRVGFHR
jgi:hypothetical protein